MFTVIVAVDENQAIGYKNNLIVRDPEDMAHFVRQTLGKRVYMGLNTYQSLGTEYLPKRHLRVITSNPDKVPTINNNETSVAPTTWADLQKQHELLLLTDRPNDIVIAGGSMLYDAVLKHDLVGNILITRFNTIAPNADCYFPEIPDHFNLIDTYSIGSGVIQHYQHMHPIRDEPINVGLPSTLMKIG